MTPAEAVGHIAVATAVGAVILIYPALTPLALLILLAWIMAT